MAEQDWEAYAASVSELEAETPEIRRAFEAGRMAGLVAAEKVVRPTYRLHMTGSEQPSTQDPIERANWALHEAANRINKLKDES